MAWSGRRIREMVRKELRQMFRDPRMKPIVFVSPIVQLILFGYAVNTDVRQVPTAIVDFDRTAESRRVIDEITRTGYFAVVPTPHRAEALTEALDRGRAVVGLTIPAGFARDIRSGRGADLQVLIDGTDSNTGTVAQGYLARIVQSLGQPDGRVPTAGIDARTRAWYNPELESRVYNVPGVIGVLLLLMCLLLTSLAVVREREIGTLDQLMVSPLTPGELMLGKTIPVAIVALIDLALITAVAVLWFEIPMRGSLLMLFPASITYIVAGLSLGLIISSISRTQQEAFMTMFMFLLPAIILSGFFYPVSSMPTVFQWITLANPVRHFLEIVRDLFLKGTGWQELWGQYAILASMAALGLWFAVKGFRRSVT